MFIRDQRFPISDGVIVTTLRAALVAKWTATGLTVGTKLPTTTKTRRMVTVRDDSGTAVGRVQPRRQGINVWADDPVDALNIALDVIHIAESALPGVKLAGQVVIAGTSGFVGPQEVDDDVPYVVGNKNLTHYFVSFIADVKASQVV